uniref:W2 domain-containing protein n=1 Tax=Steinernema glaseri TaxID=37863 RepID=A0A1I8AHL9_9BILA
MHHSPSPPQLYFSILSVRLSTMLVQLSVFTLFALATSIPMRERPPTVDLSCVYPELLKEVLTQIKENRDEIRSSIDLMFPENSTETGDVYLFMRLALDIVGVMNPKVKEEVLPLVFGELEPESNAHHKLTFFLLSFLVADFNETEYDVTNFLLHYLRFRQSYGRAAVRARLLFPVLEEFAKHEDIRKFYEQHRSEHPDSLWTAAEFSDLIKWLFKHNKLPMLKKKQ